METLTLDDRQRHREPRHVSVSREWGYGFAQPRPLTPGRSRSSGDPSDSETLPDRDSQSDGHRSEHFRKHARQQHDNHNFVGMPRSPPYQPAGASKPSLPPLKMIFGNAVSSPPKTPSPRGPYLHLPPQEPSYVTSSTHSTSALYPSKHPKLESSHASQPLYRDNAVRSPPFVGQRLQDQRPSRPEENSQSVASASFDAHMTRRLSAFEPPSTLIAPSTSWTSNQNFRGMDISGSRSGVDHSTQGHFRTLTRPPGMSLPDEGAQRFTEPYRKRERSDEFYPRPENVRRASTSNFPSYPYRDAEPERAMRDPYAPSQRYAPYHTTNERRSTGYEPYHTRRDGLPLPPFRAVTDMDAPDGQRTFLMPSSYELQHGKSRKRSNLPKQATEIMKGWFEEHLSSPYPSEEQKQIFANSTGISLTQVSNWFINHRRRNPELRDRREKGRNDVRFVGEAGRERKYSL